MLVPLEWLREHCDPPLGTGEVAARLTMTGTKDERVFHHGPPSPEGFVVGRVEAVAPHPDADRLRVCSVATGGESARTIVCGAPNVAAGQLVAVALPGAVMPDGTTLKAAKLRGVQSEGMILAEDEVGVGPGHSGVMVLASGEPGEQLSFGTDVIEFEITPNRPDCLGIYGIARELAASTDEALGIAPWAQDVAEAGALVGAQVEVACPELCPRFCARVFEDVVVGESPLWLKARLSAAGQRSINNVVDITNYVMLLCGQPLHAFDLDRVQGGKLRVRTASAGERVSTLDGVERELDPEMVVIEDGAGPTSIAGVMGGARSEVSPQTTRVLLESATWLGASIHRTSSRLGLRSEASGRFEKGLSPGGAMEALIVASRLLVELCGARPPKGTIDIGGPGPDPDPIALRPERVRGLLGKEVGPERCAEILRSLGFVVEGQQVRVPHFRRLDVTREVDLIEEIARIDGVDQLPATLPPRRGAAGRLTHSQRLVRELEDELVGRGLHEVVGWSFASPGLLERLRLPDGHPMRSLVAIENPMSEEQSILRPTLLGSLLDIAGRNRARGRAPIALFESGAVYRKEGEHHALGVLIEGEFLAAKALLEAVMARAGVPLAVAADTWPFLHPGRSAAVLAGEQKLGLLGEIHPLVTADWDLEGPLAVWVIDLGKLAEAAPEVRRYRHVSPFPAMREDLAVVLDQGVAAQAAIECVRRAGGELLQTAAVFDVYEGEQIPSGRKSLALHLEFQAPDRTLSEEEVSALREAIVGALADELGGELRG